MSQRRGGFDVVRAAAMFLGIGYHASFAYVPGIGPWYLVQDVSTEPAFAKLGSVLHVGRMQVFFVLSGFFAHLVAERGSLKAFAGDRWRRLVVPLLVAAPLVALFDWGSTAWARSAGLLEMGYRGFTDSPVRPLYLWFLEYSVLFAFACWPFLRARVKCGSPFGLLLLCLPTWAAHEWLGEPTPAFSYVPQLASLAHYGPFFLFGWLLSGDGEALASFRRCIWLLPVGLALALFVYTRDVQWQVTGHGLSSLATWAMVLGTLGLAVRLPSTVPKPIRFLVQSSYWVYLAHYPLVVAAQLLLARTQVSAWLKFAAVVTFATSGSLLSYVLFIRDSAIGRALTPGRSVSPQESS